MSKNYRMNLLLEFFLGLGIILAIIFYSSYEEDFFVNYSKEICSREDTINDALKKYDFKNS